MYYNIKFDPSPLKLRGFLLTEREIKDVKN